MLKRQDKCRDLQRCISFEPIDASSLRERKNGSADASLRFMVRLWGEVGRENWGDELRRESPDSGKTYAVKSREVSKSVVGEPLIIPAREVPWDILPPFFTINRLYKYMTPKTQLG